MKIFLSFLQSEIQHPIPAYSFWQYYIKNGIEEAGHEWSECSEVDWAKGLISQSTEEFNDWKTITWEMTLKYIKQNGTDIFLSYLYPHQIDETAIADLKAMGVLCVNFFCDNVRLFNKAPKAFQIFDLNWVPEHKAVKMYKDANLSFLNLPMPMWVESKFRTYDVMENTKISFVGSQDIQRQLLFEALHKHNPNRTFDIYGSGWLDNNQTAFPFETSKGRKIINQLTFVQKNGLYAYLNKLRARFRKVNESSFLKEYYKGKPDFENYIRITKESNITLGINRYPSFNYALKKPNTYSRLRDIEAPMLGACYLTEWTEGIENLYEIGKEIMTYTTIEDLDDKCERLLGDSKLRKHLRMAGQQRALSEHSIGASLKKIILHKF